MVRKNAFRPLISALDTFCREPLLPVTTPPFVRDAVDVKRWMFLVILALFPTIVMAIWNTGVQSFVYGSGNLSTMEQFLAASHSFKGYFSFTLPHYLSILALGCKAFLPLLAVSYIVGLGLEGIIACIRGHEVNEGFLVTGMLYPLILPPTTPLWIAACGIIFGVVIGKELFGGTGMNILNPALTARAFLFFCFPGNMTGDIWIAPTSAKISQSISMINTQGKLTEIDGYSQATALQSLNTATTDIKRIHVDAIATKYLQEKVSTYPLLEKHFRQWQKVHEIDHPLPELSWEEMQNFVTAPLQEGGLGLLPGSFPAAVHYGDTLYGYERFSNGNLFFGNIPGSMGETSTLACLIGALFLLLVGVGSWRIMLSFAIGAYLTAAAFKFFATLGFDAGAWNSAKFMLPAYRHLLMGGLAFGLVFMATDPVSSPSMHLAKWLYGLLIGLVTIVIRVINPAYPEGVMLAILFANVFAPLLDHYALQAYARRRRPLVST